MVELGLVEEFESWSAGNQGNLSSSVSSRSIRGSWLQENNVDQSELLCRFGIKIVIL